MDSREESDWEGCYGHPESSVRDPLRLQCVFHARSFERAARESEFAHPRSVVADLAKILPNSGKPEFGRAPRNDYLLLSPGFKSGMKAYRVAGRVRNSG